MIVCQCKAVTDRSIRRAVRDGAANRLEVARRCGAGIDCGGCKSVINQIIEVETERRVCSELPVLLEATVG